MTQSTPPQYPFGHGYGYAPRRGNGAAVASLVLGLLGCIPFITGLLAILFGIIGLRKTRDPAVGGNGLAVAGLVLGILSVLGWGGFGGMFGYAFLESRPAGVVAKQFFADVSAGHIDAAMANSSGILASQLHLDNRRMAQCGTLQSINLMSFNFNTFNGQTQMHLGGYAIFSGLTRHCTFDLVKIGGSYKVVAYSFQ